MKAVEFSARALALLWAGFWVFFFIAESLAWHTPIDRMAMWVGLGLLFLVAALAGWRWEVVGGALLITVGVAAAIAYAVWGPRELRFTVRMITLVVFGVPPVVAGALFLVHHHGIRSRL
jgi:hypothetical protein